ncbi:MAG: (p)ppGpp synthetase [Bacteroidota bacterium]
MKLESKDNPNKERILSDFLSNKEVFDSFKDRVINLITDLLRPTNYKILDTYGRTKAYDSLSKKIDSDLKYTSIDTITDIVGIRIISYLDSDIDGVAEIIQNEFKVDLENSSDKRNLEKDQFGYRSLHLIVSLNNARTALREYSGYVDLKCEIQIRTILQHAWAEIEHGLGYKTEYDIPDRYIRNFNRIAALLEIADIEFVRLKEALKDYKDKIGNEIKTKPEDVTLDQISLFYFNSQNEVLIQARQIIQDITHCKFVDSGDMLDGFVEKLYFFKIKTVKQLTDSLDVDKVLFFEFIKILIDGFPIDELVSSIALFHYLHFLAGKSLDAIVVKQYLEIGSMKIAGNSDYYIQLFEKAKSSIEGK